MELSLLTSGQVVTKRTCEHQIIGKKRTCSRKATVVHEDRYLCWQHSKNVIPDTRHVSFPQDCLHCIVEWLDNHDRYPLRFVCKFWCKTVGTIDQPYPMDIYLRADYPNIKPSYSLPFLTWAFETGLPGTVNVAEKVLLYGSKNLKILLVENAFPVPNDIFTLFVLSNKHYKEFNHYNSVLERMLAYRGCRPTGSIMRQLNEEARRRLRAILYRYSITYEEDSSEDSWD